MQFNISYLDAAASSLNVLLVVAHPSVASTQRQLSRFSICTKMCTVVNAHLQIIQQLLYGILGNCSTWVAIQKKTILKNLFLHGSSNSVWQLVVIVAGGVGRKLSTFYQIGCYLSQVEQLWQATCQKQQWQSAIKPKTDLSFFKGLDFTHPNRIECLRTEGSMQCLFFKKIKQNLDFFLPSPYQIANNDQYSIVQ